MPRKSIFLTLALSLLAPGLTSCVIEPSTGSTPVSTTTVTKAIKVPVTKVVKVPVTKVVKVPVPAPTVTVTETVRGPIVKVEKTTETKTLIKWKIGMPQSCSNVVKTTLEMRPQDTIISDSAGKILTALDQVNVEAFSKNYKAVNNLVQIVSNQENLIGTASATKAKQMDYLDKQIKQCRTEIKR